MGEKITMQSNGKLNIPNHPIIPFIEGDGIGPEIMEAVLNIFKANNVPLDYEFVDIKPLNIKQMENLTYDRLHTDGTKVLYPTFVNIGNKDVLSGDTNLFIIRLKAKRNVKFNLKLSNGLLVDKNLSSVVF